MQEEVEEFLESGAVEELADILEIVYAPGTSANVDAVQLEKLRHTNHEMCGGFAESILLIEVLE